MSKSQSQEFSASFPLSDILTEDVHEELLRQMDSNVKALLHGQDILDGPYHHNGELYPSQGELLPYEDYKQPFDNLAMEISQNLRSIQNIPELAPLNVSNTLSNEEYPGPFDFEVTILPNYKSKNPWVYSSVLNKVFMDMGHHFPIDFKIKNRPSTQLYIRITPQYSAEQHAQETVCRCIQHDYPMDPTNVDVVEHVRKHVIRCTNKDSQYLGNIELNQRLSIAFPFALPQIGSESVREMFFFVCKTSCSSPGMHRRAVEVIFTLEDERGEVFGRKCLNVRICACPKRDKEKEEQEQLKERSNNSASRGKKRKLSNPPNPGKVLVNQDNDMREYTLNLKITGKHNLQNVISYVETLMTAEVSRHQGQPCETQLRKNLQDIQQLVKNTTI